MIRSFEIENFKLFQNFRVDGLGRITILGGRNNVGKSSLLEALFLYHDRFNPQMSLRHMGWRGLRRYTSDPQSFFAPLFYRFDTSNMLCLEAHDGEHARRLEIRFVVSSKLRRAQLRTVDEAPERSAVHTSEGNNLAGDILEVTYSEDRRQVNSGTVKVGAAELFLKLEHELEGPPPPVAVYIGTRMQSSPGQDAQQFGAMDARGETGVVVDILRILDPHLRSLTTIAAGDAALVHADIGFDKKIPVYFLGDGITRLLRAVLGMAHARGGVLLLDDIDSGLHHSVLPKVWHALSEASERFDCQLIATTHSYACLRAAESGLSGYLDPDFVYIRLDQTPTGIKPVKYSFDELGSAIGLDLEVR